MNFRQMIDDVISRLSEESSNPTFFTEPDVKLSLNEGYETISEATHWYERSSTISLLANTIYYDLTDPAILTDTILRPRAIYSNQTRKWLEPTDVRYLDQYANPQWELSTGEPAFWLMRGLWWLGTYPHKSASSGSVKVVHSAMPVPLSADGDAPGFDSEFHPALVEYALYDLLLQDRELKMAKRHFMEYDKYERELEYKISNRDGVDRVARLRETNG